MELEALEEIDSEVKALGAQIVALTPELERYTPNLHRKLHLTFDILTNLHLKTAEQFRLVFVLPDYLRELYKSFGNALASNRASSVSTWDASIRRSEPAARSAQARTTAVPRAIPEETAIPLSMPIFRSPFCEPGWIGGIQSGICDRMRS